MKRTINLLSILLILIVSRAFAVLPTTTVLLSFKWLPDNTQMAGLSTNDYCTNITATFRSTTDVSLPTNLWPVVSFVPLTNFFNQGPLGSTWTNQIVIDGASRFWGVVMTNGNGGASPFSNLAPGLSAPAAGVLMPLVVK